MLSIGKIADGTPVLYSASPGEKALHVLAVARVLWRDDADRGPEGLRDRKTWFVLPLAPIGADWIRLEAPPALGPNPPEGSICRLPPNFDAGTAIEEAKRSLDLIAPRLCAVQLFSNRHVKLLSKAGEDREAFVKRCSDALERLRQEEGEKLRKKFGQRIERIREQKERELQKEQAEAGELRLKEQERSINILEAGLGAVFGGRRLATKLKRITAGLSRSGSKLRPARIPEADGRASDPSMDYLEEQLRDLQTEMNTEAQRIERKYGEMAAEITGETVTPDRRDFRIEQLSLVWMGANEVH